MKTPEEAIRYLEEAVWALKNMYDFPNIAASINEAVKILKPLATQDRERLALTQHWES